MKIVYLCNGLYNGAGIERIVTTKANYLSKEYGYEVYIIVSNNYGKECYFELNKCIKLIDLKLKLHSPKEIFKYIYKLSESIKKINPDVVIVATGLEGILYSFIDKKRKKIREIHFSKKSRQIENEYKSFLKKSLVKIYDKFEEKRLANYERLIVLTNEDKKNWKHSKIDVIYNALTLETEEVSKLDNKKAIAVGRLDYQKGFDRLIKSWSLIEEKDWELNIYGEGPLRRELSEMIVKYKLEKKVFLKGANKDIKEKLLESSVYILSSRHEGLPLVLLEAMECGLPLIAFECPCGPKDIIKNEYNGLLIPNNDIFELKKGIEKVLKDENFRYRIGKHSKIEAKNYSLEKIMKKWKDLLENLKEEKKGETRT